MRHVVTDMLKHVWGPDSQDIGGATEVGHIEGPKYAAI
jgi:hypothetical protein